MKKIICIAVVAAFAGVSAARADILTSGSATINYSQSAWDALASGFGVGQPVLTLSAFFNQAQVNAFNYDQVMTNTQASPAYTNQVYAMNGPMVTNLADRTTQPTTFSYIPGQLTTHAGSIGLGGIAQFTVSPLAGGGHLLYGDYTLQYDSTRILVGGTGWYLKGNISPAAAVFDLLNVTVLETNHTLTITGDLAVTYEVANFLYGTPGDTLAIVGTFSFTGQTAPPPLTMTVVGGAATINYDTNQWNTLGSGYGETPILTLAAFFDQAQVNTMTYLQTLNDVQVNPSPSNQVYVFNGPVVTNLTDRSAQPTTFVYPLGSLTNHTGVIGLGGLTRWAVYEGAGGVLLIGDYTLRYSNARRTGANSGWYLIGNVESPVPGFDLVNLTVTETTTNFTLVGDLAVSTELANVVLFTPEDEGKIVGNINLTANTVAIPEISRLAVSGGNVILQGTNGLVGSTCSVLGTTNLALPLSSWTTNFTGVFDGLGKLSNSVPFNAAETARFYRLKQP